MPSGANAAVGATQTARSPRVLSNYSKSSAFSECAKPDEDWTKIADLAMRRRVQNRIAQRRYRMALKRKSQDGHSAESTAQSNDQVQHAPKSSRARSKSSVDQPQMRTTSATDLPATARASSLSFVPPILDEQESRPPAEFQLSRSLYGATSYGTRDMMMSTHPFSCRVDPPASPCTMVATLTQSYAIHGVDHLQEWHIQPSPMTSPIFAMEDHYDSPTFSPAQASEASPLISGLPLFSTSGTMASPPLMDRLGESPDTDALLTPHTAPLSNLDETCMAGESPFDSFYPLINAEDTTWRSDADVGYH